jgi:hypothetical protein
MNYRVISSSTPSDVHAFVVNRVWAALIAVAALAILLGIAHVLVVRIKPPDRQDAVATRRRGVKALVIGTDGRASTSKVQAVMWTFAVLFAFVFLLFWGRSANCGDAAVNGGPRCKAAATARATFGQLVNNQLQSEYYVLLGFPIAAAVAAKALTTNKVATGQLTKTPIDGAGDGNKSNGDTDTTDHPPTRGIAVGTAEVISNDAGETDLLDFQYFAFTLLTLTFFFVEFLTHPANGLPHIPPTLVALSGLSVAAYTTKQALRTDVTSLITAVVPRRIQMTSGTTIAVVGSGFGQAIPTTNGNGTRPPGRVLLDGAALDVAVGAWNETEITASISAGTLSGLDPAGSGAVPLVVIDADGVQSGPFTVELVP